ncbi:MAG TPA: DNA polymerase III subunit delta [Candidatus Polarisedimenticolia bacterium]|jgi:DNA polymerase-3 subunit delta
MAATRRKPQSASREPAALVELVRRGEPLPILLATGRDWYTRDAFLNEIRRSVVTGGFEAFNETLSWGEEISGADLVDQAEMMPMGGGRRFILVRRADRIRERDVEPLARYAASPSPDTCLILVFDPGKNAALAALGKLAPAVDFAAPRDYQLARWLEAQARRLGLRLEPDAARALSELSGEDHIGAMSWLQRAGLAAAGAPITRKTIEELAGQGRDTNPFHLADAILGREPARAVGIVRDLHDTGTTGYAMIGMLEAQLRRYLKMRAEMAGGATASRVIQTASPTLPPDVRSRLARQLDSFDERRLIEAFRAARGTDRAIKSFGSGAELGHVESLVWRICAL